MTDNRLNLFIAEAREAAAHFGRVADRTPAPATVVHHNDADGMAAAAALAHAFGRLDLGWRLLPVEKVHAPLVQKIHAGADGIILYADLGGQSSALIGRHAAGPPHVFILDHHLPGGEAGGNVTHLNPEHVGISGDADVSGAAVCAVFAAELLKGASLLSTADEALLALMGLIGAVGDRQVHSGALTGVNRMLLETALAQGAVQKDSAGWRIPRLQGKFVGEIVEILNRLGSVGFYSGGAGTGVDFLLGKNSQEALRKAEQLGDLKASCFEKEADTLRKEGLAATRHFQWVDVQARFEPMGVKAIGLFLEYLIGQGLTAPDKYLIGFQHLPAEMPGLGRIEGSLTKLSARVAPDLKTAIQEGRRPDFMTLIPQASERVQGTADGCHRFMAASLIAQGREGEFMQALEDVLAEWPPPEGQPG